MNTNGHNIKNGFSGGNHSSEKKNNMASNELFDVQKIYSIVKRYIWLIVACCVIGVGAAYYLAWEYMLPIYKSNSTLLIENDVQSFPGGGGDIGGIISSSYGLTQNQTIESEIQFLKSRELSEGVARQIMNSKHLPDGSLYPILWSDYPEDSTIVSVEAVAGRIRSGLTVTPTDKGSNILSVSYESYAPHEASRIVNAALNTYQEITAEKKRASAKSALEFLENKKVELKQDLDLAEDRLSGFKNNENLIAIDSQADNLVNSFNNLEVQKQEITIQLEAISSAIENYERQLDAIKPGLGEKYSQALGPRIAKYQDQLASLELEKMILLSNNPNLKNDQESEPKLRELNRKINDIRSEIRQLTDNLMSNDESGNLGLIAGSEGNVTQEISNIQTKLTELRIEKGQLEAKLNAIDSRLQNTESFLDKVPDNQKVLGRLQRQVEMYEELFLSVSKQASEVSVWGQTRRGAGTVIDHATVPNGPVKPNKPAWLVYGFLFGLILPVGFIMLKEAINTKINSINDIKNIGYPLLAVIYDHSLLEKKKQTQSNGEEGNSISEDLVLYHHGLSPVAEAYRGLVSKILYSNPDNPPKTLMVTSSGSSEGKTTLISNMAMAFTEVGKKVLIVDCDMRRPAISRFFGVSREPGIMEVLFKDYDPKEAIKKVPIPSLNILTTGKKQPARPNSVIGSRAFRKMIEGFKFDYDFILLDSAPFGIIGDIAPILQITDGVIVNSKFLSTRTLELRHTLDQLENNSAQILGMVLNGYNPKKSIDETAVKGLYSNLYSSYYDYHDPQTKRKSYSHEKIH